MPRAKGPPVAARADSACCGIASGGRGERAVLGGLALCTARKRGRGEEAEIAPRVTKRARDVIGIEVDPWHRWDRLDLAHRRLDETARFGVGEGGADRRPAERRDDVER